MKKKRSRASTASSQPPGRGDAASQAQGSHIKGAHGGRSRQTSQRTDESAGGTFPVVGIGASAGGFDALRRLLEAMPDRPGVALVVIQHLDPTTPWTTAGADTNKSRDRSE